MFSLEEYVTASRTGADGYLKLVSIIDLMQDCSQMWMASEPILNTYFKENQMAQLLVSRQIDIKRIPQYGEKLKISTSIYDCQSLYGFRNTVICDEENNPCITSWSMGAFVSLNTNRLTKVPPELLANVKIDAKIEMNYLDRKILVSQTESQILSPVEVQKNDIDMNKHMNNAQYVRIAAEYLPDDFVVKQMRIEYKSPAKKGDLIYPKVSRISDHKIYISLTDNDNKIFAILEFSK